MGLTLVLKSHGLFSILAPNLALHWIDVSEGGLSVVVSRELKVGTRLKAGLTDRVYRGAFAATVEVQHVRESRSKPGCYVVGLRFIDPSPIMRMCIRSIVDTGALPQRSLVAAIRRVG